MLDKKAGIITFHDSRNYGAVLQAYALQQKTLELFRNVEIINYQNPKIAGELKLWNYTGGGLKGIVKASLGTVFRFRKKMAFDKYLKQYLNLSLAVDSSTIASCASEYDVMITGSDQVWNTGLTDNDMRYYLDFCQEKQVRVSYAASFGDKKFQLSEEVSKALAGFDCITLRENIMKDEVRKCTGKQPEICCDPTLLLSSAQWHEQCSRKLSKEKYLFLFMIEESAELRAYAQKLADRKGLKLISNKKDMSFFYHPTPNDLLSWILHAEYVVTNSFHGTVFCLQFHKQFVAYPYNASGKTKTRIVSLLKMFGMDDRTTDQAGLDIDRKEDWNRIEEMRKQISDVSWNYMTEFFKRAFDQPNG